MTDPTYAGLSDKSYPAWTASISAASQDPVAALERFMAETKKDRPAQYRPLLVHANERAKARDGKPFYAEGWYWRWTDRNAPPVPLTEEEIRAEVSE